MICRDIPTHGSLCGSLGGSVGQWVGSGQMTNNLINLDLIDIIQFCLKIYDLKRETPAPMGGCVGHWVGQWVNGWINGLGQVK